MVEIWVELETADVGATGAVRSVKPDIGNVLKIQMRDPNTEYKINKKAEQIYSEQTLKIPNPKSLLPLYSSSVITTMTKMYFKHSYRDISLTGTLQFQYQKENR